MTEQKGHYVHLGYHKWMLQDTARMEALKAMVADLVRPGDVVADLGTGTGILAVLARRAGARQVYAIEASPIARLTRRMIAHNAMDGVDVLEADITTVELPEPVDVVFSECLGNLAFGDRMFRKVGLFADRWLKPGGRRGPTEVRMFLQPTDCRLFGDPRPFWQRPYEGIDFSPFLPAVESEVSVVDVVSSFLHAEAAQVGAFDPYDRAERYTWTARWELPAGKTCNGLALWFDVDWSPSVTMSTSCADEGTHWAQALLRVPERALRAGDVLEAQLDVDFDEEETPSYRWSGQYRTADGSVEQRFDRRGNDPYSLDGG